MQTGPNADTAASITFLTSSNGSEESWAAEIVSISGRRMSISCDRTAVVGAAVQVRCPGYLFLAEVVSSKNADRTMVLEIRHMFRSADVEHIRQKWI